MNAGLFGLPSELDGAAPKRYVDAGPYISDPEALADPLNDNFSGLYLDLAGTRFAGASPWLLNNTPLGGGNTIDLFGGRLWRFRPNAVGVNTSGITQWLPSGTWCYRCSLTSRENNVGGQSTAGIGLYESATGKLEVFGVGVASGGTPHLWAQKWDNPNSFNSNRATFTTTGSKHFLPTVTEVEYDGANYYFRHGKGGAMREWIRFAKNNFFTTAADMIGLWLYSISAEHVKLVSPEFYRVPTSLYF